MRWLLLTATLLCQSPKAEEVTVTGYGKTVDEALQSAKIAAVEQVAGTFITGTSILEGDQYHSRTAQYNGGLIQQYEILSAIEHDGLIAVRILAEVDANKVNNVIESHGAEIPLSVISQLEKSREDYAKRKRIVEALDDPSQAFAVQVRKVTYRNRGELTDIQAELEITYSPKWYDDVHLMAQTIGRKVDMGSRWSDALWGLATLTAIVNPALPGMLFPVARRANLPPPSSPEYMVCFAKDNGWDVDECYESRQPFKSLQGDGQLRVYGSLLQGDDQIPIGEIAVGLGHEFFVDVHPGKRVYFSKSAVERTFQSKGIVLFRNGSTPFLYKMTVPTAVLIKAACVIQFESLQAPAEGPQA